jgi:hypothetical protein
MIERRVFSIVLLPLCLNIGERVLRRPRPVQNREAIAHQFTMIDQRVLNDGARASGAGDNTDLFQITQTVQPGAILRVGIILADIRVVENKADHVISAVESKSRGPRASVRQHVQQRLRSKANGFRRRLITNANINRFSLRAPVRPAQRVTVIIVYDAIPGGTDDLVNVTAVVGIERQVPKALGI